MSVYGVDSTLRCVFCCRSTAYTPPECVLIVILGLIIVVAAVVVGVAGVLGNGGTHGLGAELSEHERGSTR
jgi:hypothetical protein